MPDIPAPRTVVDPAPTTPPGNALARSLRALVVERRLPTRVAEAYDRLLINIGAGSKTIETAGMCFRVRRLAADEHFIRGVLAGDYTPRGYEISETDAIIDVGGNIGAFAVWAARTASRGKVVSLEPASENFKLLEENIRLNRLSNVTPVKAALADRAGTITLHLASRCSGDHTTDAALTSITGSRGTETVEAVTLAQVLDRYSIDRCDLIKFNCEGAEVPVVLNLDSATAARLRRIVLGYHADPRRPKRPQGDALIRKLFDLGFIIDDYTDVADTHRGMIFARANS